MCNFKHLPWINRGHYWASPWAAWCAHWSTGNVSYSPIQYGWAQCALFQDDTILIRLLIHNFFIHHKIHPTKQGFYGGRGGFSISYWLTWIVDFNSSKSLLGQNIQNQFRQGYGLLCSVPIMQWLSAKLRRVLPPPCPNMHKYLLLQSRMCVKWTIFLDIVW